MIGVLTVPVGNSPGAPQSKPRGISSSHAVGVTFVFARQTQARQELRAAAGGSRACLQSRC